MLYLTCTTIISVDLAHYGVSRAKVWVSVDCGTSSFGTNSTICFVFTFPNGGQSLTHRIVVNCSIVICWVSPFVISGVSGLLRRFYSVFDGNLYQQQFRP